MAVKPRSHCWFYTLLQHSRQLLRHNPVQTQLTLIFQHYMSLQLHKLTCQHKLTCSCHICHPPVLPKAHLPWHHAAVVCIVRMALHHNAADKQCVRCRAASIAWRTLARRATRLWPIAASWTLPRLVTMSPLLLAQMRSRLASAHPAPPRSPPLSPPPPSHTLTHSFAHTRCILAHCFGQSRPFMHCQVHRGNIGLQLCCRCYCCLHCVVARSSGKLQHRKPDLHRSATREWSAHSRHKLKLPRLTYTVLVLACCRAFIGAERATLPEANDAAAVPLVAWSAQPQVCAHPWPPQHHLQGS